MGNNNFKENLLLAIKNMPDDFALSDARYLMKSALQKIEAVEHKIKIREANSEKRKVQQLVDQAEFNRQLNLPNNQVFNTLKYIDDMIANEQIKLDVLARKKINGEVQLDADVQTIFD